MKKLLALLVIGAFLTVTTGCPPETTKSTSSTVKTTTATGGVKMGGGKGMEARTEPVLILEEETIDIIPEKSATVKAKTGKPVSAEAPKDSGLTAKVEDDHVAIAAAKDAKEGTHTVTVKDAKGKEATVKVHVKKK
jgi:hypothetical protein